ncbi:MAG: TonB-dependent receptor, partial [Deltaproteobacteria bacterium]|nr:TonB-dependent receptor [Deltaproteobacteria bacterium]
SCYWDKKLTVNLTLFQMDIHNQQLIQYPPAAAGFFFKNIGSARNWGLEVEIFARPLRGLEILAGFGLVESSYITAYDEASGTNYAGNRIPFAPRFTYNLAAQYRLLLGSNFSLFARIELNGVGSTSWDVANSVSSGSYHLLNARVGIESKHVDIHFFARNLLDKVYESAVFVFPGADPLAVPGTPMYFGAMCTFWI